MAVINTKVDLGSLEAPRNCRGLKTISFSNIAICSENPDPKDHVAIQSKCNEKFWSFRVIPHPKHYDPVHGPMDLALVVVLGEPNAGPMVAFTFTGFFAWILVLVVAVLICVEVSSLWP